MHPLTFARSWDSPHCGHTVSSSSTFIRAAAEIAGRGGWALIGAEDYRANVSGMEWGG
jgi:hypothetical protein